MDDADFKPMLGEVARRLDDVFKRFEQLANDLPKTFVSKELYDAYRETATAQQDQLKIVIDNQSKRIEDLEDDKKWLWRLVVGAVIMALLGLLLTTTHAISGSAPKSSNSGLTASVVVTE